MTGDAVEILIVLGVMAALAAVVWVPWALLIQSGVALVAIGLCIGVPTGLAYHVKLRSCLLESAALPARWWLEPVRLHQRLDAEALRRVLPWFYAGGLGFLITALGLALALLSLPGLSGLTSGS